MGEELEIVLLGQTTDRSEQFGRIGRHFLLGQRLVLNGWAQRLFLSVGMEGRRRNASEIRVKYG